MGRQKKPFPIGHFRLRYLKNYDKSKIYPIEIVYIFGGRTIKRSMNMSVAVADWNPNGNNGRGEIRASDSCSVPLNKIIMKKRNKVYSGLNSYHQKFPDQVNEDVIAAFRYEKPLTRRDKVEDFAIYI